MSEGTTIPVPDTFALTEFSGDQLDPYMDACPDWCEDRERGHRIVRSEDDRTHFGPVTWVTVRSLPMDYQTGAPSEVTYSPARIGVYLRRRAMHRDAQVTLEVEETPKSATIADLTIAEADELAQAIAWQVTTALADTSGV